MPHYGRFTPPTLSIICTKRPYLGVSTAEVLANVHINLLYGLSPLRLPSTYTSNSNHTFGPPRTRFGIRARYGKPPSRPAVILRNPWG
jgi:hypothetical protein